MSYFPLRDAALPSTKNAKQKLCYLVCGCILFSFWLFFYSAFEQNEFYNSVHLHGKYSSHHFLTNHLVINQQGCRIPEMTIRGSFVSKFIQEQPPLFCDLAKISNDSRKVVRLPPLVSDSQDSLTIIESNLKYYGRTSVNCTIVSFRRASKSNGDVVIDDCVEFSDQIQPLNATSPAHIDSEFVKVQCTDGTEQSFFTDFFAFVPLRAKVEKRCEKFELENKNSNSRTLNVVIVGLDALSRLNFLRQMPKSAKYLEHNLDAISMKGFNKVGDNTFPNLIPTLTGLSVDKLKRHCWPSSKHVFDKCPFIWNDFRNNGFRTVFAEDSPSIGVFNYLKNGFKRQPTDYYLRPFYVQAEKEIASQKPLNCYLCIGSRLSLSIVLRYAYKHALTWINKKFFGFFWSTSFTHDFFNLPTQGDEALLQFLENFHVNNLTESTALIIMSDHGLRWGTFRETFQGHLEERLPMLMFVLPAWFKEKYKRATENLRANTEMLTTHFDLYHTLLDFTNLSRIEDNVLISEREGSGRRSQSLFTPILTTRNCKTAKIPRNYCTCHDKVKNLNVNDHMTKKAAKHLVKKLNLVIEKHPECAKLQLLSIENAALESSTMGGKGSNLTDAIANIVLSVKVIPGNGLFEGIVSYNAENRKYNVVGQISRINTYGSQSFCVDDNILKLYCYCKL